MCKEIGAIKYMECSSQTHTGVNDLFEEAVHTVRERSARRKKKSCLLL